MSGKKANKSTPSTQEFLQIAEIRDDTIIMKDGSLRAVLLVSSVNFALKSEDEQNAIIAAYVSFLNLLESPLQIVIQSRKLDLDQYLEFLKELEEKQKNDLLKIQTTEYRQYISELVELGNIMTKRFYVVVPYSVFGEKKRSFWQRLNDLLYPASAIRINQKVFLQRQKDLFIIVDRIITGLASMGLRSQVLDTQALIELFYNTYNPTISRNQKLQDLNKLMVEQEI